MKYFFLSGSLRKDSLNTKLLHMAAQHLNCPASDIANINDLLIPLYSGDIEAVGIPDNVQKLAKCIDQAQALIIASPEYNYSISGVLKNFIDWVSRVRPMPLKQKPILLMAASPGPIAGIRGLWHTRVPLEGLGNYVFPEMFSLGGSFQAFDEKGFVNPDDQKRFAAALAGFTEFSNNLLSQS
jgi:chromate reductase, NAD(P)H dehydrogenase (quinone)